MLDATGALAWTLADTGALDQVDVISSMSALYESFEAEFDADNADGVLKTLQEQLSFALTGGEDIFYLADNQDDTRFGDLEDTFERVRLAAQGVVDEYKDDLSALISAKLADVISLASSVYDAVPTLDSETQRTLDDLEFPADPPAPATPPTPADPNYLKFTDPLTGVVTEFYNPNLVETKPEVQPAPKTTTTPEVAAEPAEYGFDGYSPNDHFELMDILSNEAYLTAMRDGAELFSDELTTNIRDFIEALGDVDMVSPTGDFAAGSGIEIGVDEVEDKFVNASTQTRTTGNVFLPAELDDLAKYFTDFMRDGSRVLGEELDVSAKDFASVNGTVIRSIGVVDDDGPVADVGATGFTDADDAPDELWDYLLHVDTLTQVITQEALFERSDIVADGAVFRGNLMQRIDDFLDALDIKVGDVGTDGMVIDEPARILSADAKGYIRTVWSQSLETVLNNLGDTDANLQDIQNYTASAASAPGKLNISIDMPFFDTLLNELELDGKLRASLPVGFDFQNTQTNLSFTLESITAAAIGGEVASVGLKMGEFMLDNGGVLFEFGAANTTAELLGGISVTGTNNVTGLSSLTELPFGFLSANLTGISTGQIGLYTDFIEAGGDALGREFVFDIDAFEADVTAASAVVTATGDDFKFVLRAQEVDANDVLTIDLATSIDAIDLVRYDFSAALPTNFGSSNSSNAVSKVDVQLTQSAVFNGDFGFILDTINGDETANAATGFDTIFEGTSVQFGFPAGGIAGTALGDVYEAMFFTSPLMIGEFISSLGSGISELLVQDDFSVRVPLTDIDLADAFAGIADVFSDLTSLFDIDPKDLGFVQTSAEGNVGGIGEAPSFLLGREITDVTGIQLNGEDIAKLASISSITFETYRYNEATELYVRAEQTIDLSSLEPFDFYGEVADGNAFLADLVAALNADGPTAGLAALGWVATVQGSGLNFALATGETATSTGSLTIKDSSLRTGTGPTLTLKDLGIRAGHQTTLEEPVAAGSDVNVLAIQDGQLEVNLGTLNTSTLYTMDAVRFVIAVDGVFQTVDVDAPPNGWGLVRPSADITIDPASAVFDATDTSILNMLIVQFNAAMGDYNINLKAGVNDAGDGLKLSLNNPTSGPNVQIALDPEALTRAFSMKGLAVWFEEAFAQIPCMPEFEINVNTDSGDITLGFLAPVKKEVTTSQSLDIDDFELGGLQGVKLQAQLDAAITASVSMTAGFNIIDMQAQYKKSYGANSTDDAATDFGLTPKELDNYENNRGFIDKIQPVVLDNTFITDLKFNAVLDATVSAFEGEASMGMVGIGIGTNGPSTVSNFGRMNTELMIDLVGQSKGAFSDRISGTQLLSLASGQVIDYYLDPDGVTQVPSAPLLTNTFEDPAATYDDPATSSVVETRPGDDTRLVSITSNLGTPEDESDDVTYTVIRNAAGAKTGTYTSDMGTVDVSDDVVVTALPNFTPVLGPAPAGARFVDLLGKVELVGGILVDSNGCALKITNVGATGSTSDDIFEKNENLNTFDQLVIHNGDDRVDGKNYSMFQLNFDLPELQIGNVTVGGGAIGAGLGNAIIQVSISDLFDIGNTTKLCTDLEQLLCLALVDPNLLLEGVAGFGLLLEGFVDNLERNFPVLSTEVPLLNGTLLEQFDFIGDFNDGLEKTQATGGLSFENINDLFADAFGQDVLTLNLVSVAGVGVEGDTGYVEAVCELQLGLELSFLDDFKLTESFNLSLSTLLGEDGLNHLIGEAGATDQLEGVFSSLVDARGDAELVIDPALNLDFHLGLDLFAMKNSLLGDNLRADVVEDTNINDLSTVAMLTTNGLGSVDLRIDWADEDIILGDSDPDPNAPAETLLVTAGAFSLLLDFDKIIQDNTDASDPTDVLTVGELIAAMNAELIDLIATLDGDLKIRVDGNVRIAFETVPNPTLADPSAKTMTFKLVDDLSDARNSTGVVALFGDVQSHDGGDIAPITNPVTAYVSREFGVADTDYTAEYKFAIKVGDGPAVDVTIEALENRTKEDFIRDFNRTLLDISVGRDQISGTALIGTVVPLSQLFRVVLDGSDVKLKTTNFAENNGYNEFAIGIVGNDVAHNVTFTVSEEENSNAARLMGFGSGFLFDGEATFEGNASSNDLFLANTVNTPIIYINTEKTNISAELGVGVPGGLNVIVNLGPFEASIENGTIFIGASGEGTERGYIKGAIADIDNNASDGRYDLLNLYTLSQEEAPDYLELFGLSMDFETRVDLPFSGAFGLLNPDNHGFEYVSTLLRTQNVGGTEGDLTVSASDIHNAMEAAQTEKGSVQLTALERADALLPFLRGDAKEIYRAAIAATTGTGTAEEKAEAAAKILAPLALSFTDKPVGSPYNAAGVLVNSEIYFAANATGPSAAIAELGALDLEFGPHYIALKLPELPGCGDLLDLINNPLAIVNGLDMVMGTIQDFVTDAFSGLDLPMVGTNLMRGAQFFSDLRYDVIDGARDYLETPIDHDNDASTPNELPTTLDLVNTFMNDALGALLGSSTGLKARFQMDAYDAGSDDHALYGGLVLDYTVFEESLDVGFALDIPGLNLEVDDSSKLNFLSTLKLDLGFGLDCNGFFLLNKFDDGTNANFKPEAVFEIKATVDPDFEAAMNIGGVLEVTAKAAEGFLVSTENPKDDTEVVASLSLDLFGAAGFDHAGTEGKVQRDYTFTEGALAPLGFGGTTAAEFNRMVYLSQIDFNDFADVDFNVDISIDLDMKVAFAGVSAVPTLLADFIFEANYNPEVNAKDLSITTFEFHKISLDIASLEKVFEPIIDPIVTLIGPIKSMISAMDVMPFNFFIDAFKSTFPIFNVIDQLDSIVSFIDDLKSDDPNNPAQICIGNYDFIGVSKINVADVGDPVETVKGVWLSQFSISNAVFKPCFDFNFDLSFGGSVQGPGVTFKIPLLQDPSNALNMMLGRFDQVDLARVQVNLLTGNANLDVAGQILGNVGLPSWAASAIRGGFTANVNADLKAAIEFGYDLSGVVNFANTLDPERLLDGIFIDPDLLAISISGNMGVSAYIAGASGSITANIDLDIRDPNSDGKIRLPELLHILDSFGNQSGLEAKLGALFNGSVNMSAALRFWAGVNLPWPLPDLSWSTTLFDTTIFNYSLPAPPPAPLISSSLGGTSFVMLNAGAQAGANLTSLDFDGNDNISLTGGPISYLVDYTSNGQRFAGNTAQSTVGSNEIVIAAGEGRNTINLSGMTGSPNTITYLGDENDTITLANSGVHVVFAGDGNDTIKIGTSGTYYIFGEGGADNIRADSSLSSSAKVFVFADDDYGMRDYFKKTYSGKSSSAPSIEDAIETGKNFSVSNELQDLDFLTENYTRISQSKPGTDVETVTINGSGTVNVFTGSGADKITVTSSAGSERNIYSGAGDDVISAGETGSLGGTTYIEAGAGDDLVVLNGNGTNTVYGWGAQAEQLGTGDKSAVKIYARDARLLSDEDLIIGGDAVDTIYGQYGKDILSGQLGDDVIYAGADDDLASGGILKVFTVDGNGNKDVELDLKTPGVLAQVNTTLIVETDTSAADGADEIYGGAGSDVLLGGFGADTLGGGSSADILVGDYGRISVSSNRIAQTFISTGIDAAGGKDVLSGGGGNDILVGGAGAGVEEFTDLEGNNIVIGDFGTVEGNRILEAVKAYRSIASSTGSQDNITTGAGNDVIIGGEGSDTIDGGSGGDVIIGDLGSFVPSDGTVTNAYYNSAGVLLANTTLGGAALNEGHDVISLGLDSAKNAIGSDLFDIVLGGGGGDTITGGIGGMVVMGDYGNIQLDSDSVRTLFSFIPRETPPTDDDETTDAQSYRARIKQIERIFQSVSSIDADENALGDGRSGNDSITTVGGTVYSVLGGGNDSVNLGDGLSYIVTDDGEMAIERLKDDDGALPEFGTVKGISVSTSGAGADFVKTRLGRDIILTGDSDDVIEAGDGLNFVLADNGSLQSSDDTTALPTSLENKADANDGNDTYTGGAGTDYVIMGGRADTVDGGAGRNFILGDSGIMEFEASSPSGYTATLTSNAIIADHFDGDDTFTGTGGENFIIAGLGDADKTIEDKITFLGAGNNTIMTNSGSFKYTLEEDGSENIVSTVTPLNALGIDGNDSVTTGAGRDIIALGMGADTAHLGDGDNYALGGAGKIELLLETSGAQTIRLTAAELSSIESDGDDSVTSGLGRDIVALGMGSDTANLGEGNNYALGGAGEIYVKIFETGAENVRLTSTEVSEIEKDGDDHITTGDGRDVVALGLGADFAELGNGINFALGDAGEIVLTLGAALPGVSAAQNVRIQSAATSMLLDGQDGNDTVNAGDNDDFIVLGLGDDVGNFGNGRAFGVGSDGTVVYDQAAGTTAFEYEINSNEIVGALYDGDDTINAVNGDDYIVLGLGDDVANVGDGRNRVIGDQGRISGGPAANVEEIQSTYLNLGGDDRVSSGKDEDIFVLGQGAEIADSGAGNDILIGDNAFIQRVGTGGLHSLQVYTTGGGGDDSLKGGGDNDIIIGSLGADTLIAGSGNDFILGDLGDLTFRNDTDVASLTYTARDVGGDDLITATGAGDNVMIGQAGADIISGGDGDDLIVGDLAEISFTDVRSAQSGQSVVDRLSDLEFVGTSLIYDDRLDGNDGADMLIGGFGADTLNGGAGQDFLFGDTIMITRTLDSANVETLQMDTNFVYLTGGIDALDGGTGNNIVVGGLGADLFFGDTESQVLAGDGFAAFTHASFAGGFNGATPNRELITVNFAGPFAVDVLTFSQLEESIGAFFSAGATQEALETNGYKPFVHTELASIMSQYSPKTLAYIEAFFEQDTTITKLAELLYFGADPELITDEMLRLLAFFQGDVTVAKDATHFAMFKLLLQRVLDELKTEERAPAEEGAEATDADTTQMDEDPETAVLQAHEIATLQAVM